MTDWKRAVRAWSDVLAVIHDDPGSGFVTVVTESGHYPVDVRENRCTCPDYEYNLDMGAKGPCKHLLAAYDAVGALDVGHHDLEGSLEDRDEETPLVADGGQDIRRGVYTRPEELS